MYSQLKTCVLNGIEGYIVNVETDLQNGMPIFNIVGLPDISIKESKERVRAAIKNSSYEFPLQRITVNLAPANLRKEGSQMDLPIAIGILKAGNVIFEDIDEDTAILGELSLDGEIYGINGILPMVISLRDLGVKKIVIPFDNRFEAAPVKDVEIIPVKSLSDLVRYLNKELEIKNTDGLVEEGGEVHYDVDFSDIKGQVALKRGMEVAAAGGHNLLMIGPPGSGKTMAAMRLPTILPDLTFEESIEVTKIYSITGELKKSGLVKERPFRAPHHTASAVSLIGGGRIPKPGEVSLAHNGVLFLDELPEFSRNVLEVLRQPMEDRLVNITRANASLTFLSNFMLVASMNPCPCGYLGDPTHECTCSQNSISAYLNKISSPLLDRIDLHMEVSQVKFKEIDSLEKGESSSVIRERVRKAREIQTERFKDTKIFSNAMMNGNQISKYCPLSNSSKKLLEAAFDRYGFSARTHGKILKIARTVADLKGSENIGDEDLLEAIRYRTINKKYWER
ncbi:MAG: YifB family Mg chelatase-like AAA ATPase [Tissierellia bacterium]|nr:YifB family Mg chelatase-like AAA ATPase [Tissierellia bacterium]